MISKRSAARASACVAVVLCAGLAPAQVVWNEVGDAGATLATAQQPTGSGPLTRINGLLTFGGDADLYRIRVTDEQAFSASAIASLGTQAPPLFLFDSQGRGVAQARGRSSGEGGLGPVPSRIDSTFVVAPGDYFLAIATQQTVALSAMSRRIWANPPGVQSQLAPDGPGAANPLVSFQTPFVAGGAYTIDLTGAAPVPAPGVLGLAALASVCVAHRRRERAANI